LFEITEAGAVAQDQIRPFPTLNGNGNFVGAVVFHGDRVFALECNNGIMAFSIQEQPFVPQIFWTQTGGFVESQGSVWAATIAGQGKRTIATELSRPIGITLDEGNGHVYWAEDGFGGQPSRIVRANLDGSDQAVLFSEHVEGFTNAQMLALDPANEHVYWTDYFLGVIRGNFDGTGYTILGGSGAQYTALDLDLVNGHIYYGDPTQFGVLFRMDINGGNDIELARDLAAENWRFNSIALDVPNGHIYYTDAGTHEIKRMDLDGSNQFPILSDLELPGLNPYGITFGSANTLYWVGGLGQRLGTAGSDGSDPTWELVRLSGTTAFGIAVLPSAPASDLRITGITAADSIVTITWEGGQPPFQLLRRASVSEGNWEPVGDPTASNQATDGISGVTMFYQIQGN
jgi:hypothetical protein